MANKEERGKRCAIYVRKSTTQGLDQDYNSLDAQRDAALAYIKSQESNGWFLEKEYRDGGFSGGNTNRPALKELVKDVAERKIDVVVVYKIDRLSRSLTDFSKLHSIFEANEVAFISVTQQLDTSTATGRMVMNILASFSQFEREMIRDRIRDKIRASLRLGMFMGGRIPFGYNLIDHKLIPNPETAPLAKTIFTRFLRSKSLSTVARGLNRGKVERDPGKKWTSGMVRTILKDPRYIGKCKCAGELYQGQHAPLIEEPLWNKVQSALERSKRPRNKHPQKKLSKQHPLIRVLKIGHGLLSFLDSQKAECIEDVREALQPTNAPAKNELI